MKNKDFSLYTSKDILDYWKKKYKKVFNNTYSSFIGYELKMIKGLLESYGVFNILLSIDNCMSRGDNIIIKYFIDRIDQYLPDTKYPDIYLKIKLFGGTEELEKLKILEQLENRCFINPITIRDEKKIVSDLQKWVSENVVY